MAAARPQKDDFGPAERIGVEPTVVASTPDFAVATTASLVVVLWRRAPTVTAAQVIERCIRKHTSQVGRCGMLSVVEEDAPIPDVNGRRAGAEVLRQAPLAFSAIVIEGTGFRAAAARGVTTGISMQAKPHFPYRSFASLDEAIGWVADMARSETTTPITPTRVSRAVAVLRALSRR